MERKCCHEIFCRYAGFAGGTYATAAVYALTTENNTKPQRIFQGKLSEVNASVVESDRQIAGMIRSGEIDGIVVMSADPVKANQAVFDAAVEM